MYKIVLIHSFEIQNPETGSRISDSENPGFQSLANPDFFSLLNIRPVFIPDLYYHTIYLDEWYIVHLRGWVAALCKNKNVEFFLNTLCLRHKLSLKGVFII